MQSLSQSEKEETIVEGRRKGKTRSEKLLFSRTMLIKSKRRTPKPLRKSQFYISLKQRIDTMDGTR